MIFLKLFSYLVTELKTATQSLASRNNLTKNGYLQKINYIEAKQSNFSCVPARHLWSNIVYIVDLQEYLGV